MSLRSHKTKIVATIGPACDAPAILDQMIRAGLSVARLDFSHGTFDEHAARIDRLRAAASAAGREIAMMADLPGPKMRIGHCWSRVRPPPTRTQTTAWKSCRCSNVLRWEQS